MNCNICNCQSEPIFNALVLKKYTVKYYQCIGCKFIQTEEPYWLNESYKSAINISDTGIVKRNELFRRLVSVLIKYCLNTQAKFIDFAGGYGLFTRMMRDIGFDYYWIDPHCQNLVARGFEHVDSNNYEAVTSFEVFEHLAHPIKDIENMLTYANTIIFSTELIQDNIPDKNWWYYGFEHGQHVALYSHQSLTYIANKYKLNLLSNGRNFHMLTSKNISNNKFNLLIKLSKYGLYKFVVFNKTGLTLSDSEMLKK